MLLESDPLTHGLIWCVFVVAIVLASAWLLFFIVRLALGKGILSRRCFPTISGRTAPWGLPEIVFMLFLYLILVNFSHGIISLVLPIPASQNATAFDHTAPSNAKPAQSELQPQKDDPLRQEHQLMILIRRSGNRPIVLVVCFLAAVVFAPIAEEFLFRVVLQSGLEATFHLNFSSRFVRAALPVLLSSLIFAAVHFRAKIPTADKTGIITDADVDQQFNLLLTTILTNTLIVIFGILFLRFFSKADWKDLGLHGFRHWKNDLSGTFFLFLAIIIPLLTLQIVFHTLLSGTVTPDPFPLFFLAMILGTLFFRTRRLFPSVCLHALINSFSFLILLLTLYCAGNKN